MDNGVVTTDPTCTAEGVKTYTCQRNCGHSTTEPVDALGHAYDDGVVTTEPTCTEKGVKTFTCANDPSHTYTEDVDPLGHATELETLPAKAATCTDSGLKEGKKCPVCKTTVVAQEVVPAHGHKWDAGTVTKAPTKYAKGEKTYYCEYDNNHMYVVDIPKLANYDGYDYVPKTGDNTMVVMSSAAVVSLLAAAAYVTGKKKSAC